MRYRRWQIIGVLVILLSMALVTPALAHEGHECDHHHHLATIESLADHVEHAAMMGHISNAGVANSLLAKLSAAQAALDRGQTVVAVNNLNAFVNQLEAQAGNQVLEPHASCLIHHAHQVHMALG
jgi:hypothetical protein